MRTACLLLLGLLPWPVAADVMGRVVSVADGDSLTVLVNDRDQVNVRLLGVDAPEVSQDFAKQSQSNLGAYTLGKEVRVDGDKKDARGRLLAKVWAADSACREAACPKTMDVGLAQIAAGMAWHDQHHVKDQAPAERQSYAEAEFLAKIRRLGLWAGKNPVAPWAWQRQRLTE